MPEPKIPRHKSELPGIEIEVKSFHENVAKAGRGDHLLEDWYWEVTITNTGNPFCTAIGFWGVYIVRSKIEARLKFNHSDNASTIQLTPGDEPKLLCVKDVDLGEHGVGIGLSMLFSNRFEEDLVLDYGLYRYSR